MSTSAESAWGEGWRVRIQSRLDPQGHKDIRDFLAANPGIPYVELARELGDDVAASQLLHLQIGEGLRGGTVREMAMDMLVRFLRGRLPDGWTHKQAERVSLETGQALSDWSSEFRLDSRITQYYESVRNIVTYFLKRPPPSGWRPEDSSDQYIQDAFDTEWPRGVDPDRS